MSTMNSTVVKLKCLPHGLFEKELYSYFHQFGAIKRVRLLRSKKGKANGIAFIEFKKVAVAEIAAETMDNYLLAEKRIRCKILKNDELPKCITKGGGTFIPIVKPMQARLRHAQQHFIKKTPLQEERQMKRFVAGIKRRMKKIEDMGIDYSFDYETKLADTKKKHTRTGPKKSDNNKKDVEESTGNRKQKPTKKQ